mmetsp:Transcript_56508/g.156277  ORF Transcript_56508/g.156277 Transcript_56508/m.156277 type:complete len:206 (+) Transcript_56508:1897-2514(+)
MHAPSLCARDLGIFPALEVKDGPEAHENAKVRHEPAIDLRPEVAVVGVIRRVADCVRKIEEARGREEGYEPGPRRHRQKGRVVCRPPVVQANFLSEVVLERVTVDVPRHRVHVDHVVDTTQKLVFVVQREESLEALLLLAQSLRILELATALALAALDDRDDQLDTIDTAEGCARPPLLEVERLFVFIRAVLAVQVFVERRQAQL